MTPLLAEFLGALARWALTFLGAALVEHHVITADQNDRFTNAIVEHVMMAAPLVAALAWSLWAKYRSRIKLLTALESEAGTPEQKVDARIKSGLGATLVIALLAMPTVATAQAFGLDDSWNNVPITATLAAVKATITAGKCGDDALTFLNAQHVPTVFVAQGTPIEAQPRGIVIWYNRPLAEPNAYCGASKFQFLGPESVYPQGWEVGLWSPNWATQPPRWRLNPYAPPTGDVPPPVITQPPPVVTPPPAPPPPVPALDLSAIVSRLDTLIADGRGAHQQVMSKLDDLGERIDEPGWFKKLVSNHYAQIAGAVLATCSASPDCRNLIFGGGK